MPESGTPAAIGYAEASGIPYSAGLMKNAYVGRTFIQPSQTIRQLGIRLKLNPLRENVRGKRMVVVDDSIVRGNTQRAHVRMLREAGALEVHVRISSPPVKWPCFYGIDFATRAELIANGLDIDGIRRSIGADSLGYVSLDGLVAGDRAAEDAAVHGLLRRASTRSSCRPGNLIGKHVLEGVGKRAAMPDADRAGGDGRGRRARAATTYASVRDGRRAPTPLVASPRGATRRRAPRVDRAAATA